MSARNQICTCGHSFMDHTPEYNDDCDMCDCFEFEFGYDLTIRPQNDTGENSKIILKNLINDFMELSQEQEDSDVKYFASLTEKQFLETILSYLNDPTSRDSMRIATAREAIIQRQIGLKK